MQHDTEPPPSGEIARPMTREELDAIVADQDPEYRAAWAAYTAPLRAEEK